MNGLIRRGQKKAARKGKNGLGKPFFSVREDKNVQAFVTEALRFSVKVTGRDPKVTAVYHQRRVLSSCKTSNFLRPVFYVSFLPNDSLFSSDYSKDRLLSVGHFLAIPPRQKIKAIIFNKRVPTGLRLAE